MHGGIYITYKSRDIQSREKKSNKRTTKREKTRLEALCIKASEMIINIGHYRTNIRVKMIAWRD